MTEKKIPQIKFAPGVLEQLEADLNPEELQAFMDELKQMAETGEIESKSEPLDMQTLEIEDPELFNLLLQQYEAVTEEETKPTVH